MHGRRACGRLAVSHARSRRPSQRSVAYPGDDGPPPRRRRAARPRRGRPRRQRRSGSSPPTSGPRPRGCDLVAFPELAITGYPPEDLLLRPAFVARGRRGARQGRGPHRPHGGGGRLPRGGPRPLQRGGGLRQRPRAGRLPQAPAPELRGVRRAAVLHAVDRSTGRCSSSAGVRVGVTDLRGRVEPERSDRSRRRRVAPSWWSTSTRRPTTPAASHERETMLATRAADASVPVALREPRRRPGRARLRRRVDGVRRGGPPRRARAKQFDEDLLVVDVDVRPAFRRRLLDPRGRCARRAAARGRGQRGRSSASAHDAARIEPMLDAGRARSTRRSCSARATTCARTASRDVVIGLSGGIDSSLVARDRRRRARARARHRRAHAVALLERGQRHRRRRRSPPTSASAR